MMLKLGGDIVQALQLSGPGGGTARTGDLQTIAMLERKPRVDGVPRHAGRDDLRAPGFTHFWESLVRLGPSPSISRWSRSSAGASRSRPLRCSRSEPYLPLPDILVCSLLDQGQVGDPCDGAPADAYAPSRPRSPIRAMVVPGSIRRGGTATTFVPTRHNRIRLASLMTSTSSNSMRPEPSIMTRSRSGSEGREGAGCAARGYARGSRTRA